MDQITPGMTYGLALLAVGAYSIPLLLIGWLCRSARTPFGACRGLGASGCSIGET